ncbi:MAG: hypothetical protein ACO1SV_18800 [Fimbriimonas sp.]
MRNGPVHDQGSTRRTYSIGLTTVERFEALVPPGQRSQMVEELLEQRLQEMEEAQLRKQIEEGLAYMADVYDETSQAWAHVDREGWPTP